MSDEERRCVGTCITCVPDCPNLAHNHKPALPGKEEMTMLLRHETPADHEAIRTINQAAFADHPHSQQTEHLIVEALRADNALTLSLVAEMDGTVLGHVAFSVAYIDGKECGWYALGPVAVLPEQQHNGIGSALIRTGLEALRTLGAEGCVLVGEPAYYHRFGFRQAAPLEMDDIPPQYVMALPLKETVPAGKITHHPAFHIQPE